MNVGQALGELAEEHGYSRADLAHLAGLAKPTIGALWCEPDWRTRATGRTLAAIDNVLPGVFAPRDRTGDLADALAGHGLTLNRAAVTGHGLTPQHVHIALSAALRLMEGDPKAVAKTMCRMWGHDQSAALALVFGSAFTDPAPLVTAAVDVAGRLTQTGFHAVVARAALGYHVARATGTVLTFEPPRQAIHRAFVARSATLGAIKTGDLDHVARYHQLVTTSRPAQLVEAYAYPSYCRDVTTAGSSFWLPKGATLARTATEVIREVGTEPEAYLSYLGRIFLPLILARDPSFAGRHHDLAAAIAARRPTITDPEVATDLDTLTRNLQRTNP